MSSIIELKNVEKIYTGAVDTQVLFDINLSFDSGSCNSIVGESVSYTHLTLPTTPYV